MSFFKLPCGLVVIRNPNLVAETVVRSSCEIAVNGFSVTSIVVSSEWLLTVEPVEIAAAVRTEVHKLGPRLQHKRPREPSPGSET